LNVTIPEMRKSLSQQREIHSTGIWLDTPLAREIRAMFPLKVSLGKYGNREYYGSMPIRPENTEEGQLTFVNAT